MTTIKLPNTVEEFKAALKRGIVRFQGSPVSNENKLNESTAVALELSNQDILSALNTKKEKQVKRFNIDMAQGGLCFVNGQAIHPEVNENGLANYTIIEREEMIEDILNRISHYESGSANRMFMEDTLEKLYKVNDELVFSSKHDNEVISKTANPERFNEICEKMLEVDKAYEEE